MITITSLRHPTMIQRLELALKLSSSSLGHLMGGHGKRVYIQNRHGHNIMRLDYHAVGQFTVWGEESRDITHMVRKALGMPPAKLGLNCTVIKVATPEPTLLLSKQHDNAIVFKVMGEERYIVRDNNGQTIGTYSYQSAAELKAFMYRPNGD